MDNKLLTDFFKFKLINDTKIPMCKWLKQECWNKHLPTGCGYNIGILTGFVNNIIGVDLDLYKWKSDHSFYKEFGDDLTIFDTLIQKTCSGGYHLIFIYDKDIPQTQNSSYHIDIKSNGGYLVGAGSTIEGKSYSIFNNRPISKIPPKLKKYLLDNLYTKDQIKQLKKVNKEKEKNQVLYQEEDTSIYRYDISNIQIIKELINKVPKFNQLSSRKNWYDFSVSIKQMTVGNTKEEIKALKKLWINQSKKFDGYDNKDNTKIYNAIKITTNTIGLDSCLTWGDKKEDNCRYLLGYLKYKPIPLDTYPPTEIIDNPNEKHLGNILQPNINYCIKSPTGTGKTTTFKQYIGNEPFISVVSRVSLGLEQYQVFNDAGIQSHFYKYTAGCDINLNMKFGCCESYIVQIDSIVRQLYNADFTQYILFLDEFNSMVEYLMDASSLSHRAMVFKFFVRMITECKQIICVDADLSDICFTLLNFCGKLDNNFKYIDNKRKQYNNIIAEEAFTYDSIIKQISTAIDAGFKTLICCDSKKEVKHLGISLKRYNVKEIYSGTTEDDRFKIDNHHHLIISPKIIYGLDGQIPRKVFCLYKENTILPTAMLQQASRSRNIISLTYFFNQKIPRVSNYSNVEEVGSRITEEEKYARMEFEMTCEPQLNHIYLKMLETLRYKQDCYRTNIHLHFVRLLKDRGFVINTEIKKTKRINEKKHKLAVEKRDDETFDPTADYVVELNRFLRLSAEEIIEHKSLFLYDEYLENHINICDGCFINDAKAIKLIQSTENDFNINTICDNRSKIMYLNKVKQDTEFYIDDDGFIECNKPYNQTNATKIYDEYIIIFKQSRHKRPLLTDKYSCIKHMSGMIKELYGKEVIQSHPKMINRVRQNRYWYNDDLISYHKTIYKIRNKGYECLISDEEDDINQDVDDFECL